MENYHADNGKKTLSFQPNNTEKRNETGASHLSEVAEGFDCEL